MVDGCNFVKDIKSSPIVNSNGVFTLSGTITERGTGTGTQPLSWFRCHVKASPQFHTTYLFSVPLLVSVPASVDVPQQI